MVGPTTFGYQNLGFGAGGVVEAGSLELIETKVISNDATADFTSLGTYNTHLFTYNDLRLHDNRDLELRVFVSGSIVDSGTVNGVNLEDGDFTFGVQSRNDKLVVKLINTSHLPSNFVNAEWLAYYTQSGSNS